MTDMPDLATAEGMRVFALDFAGFIRRAFDDCGTVITTIGLVATYDPASETSFSKPMGVMVVSPDVHMGPTQERVDRQKDDLADFIRLAAKETKAIGVVMALEAWMAHPKSAKEAAEYLAGERRAANDPSREEVAMITAEHIRFPHPMMWTATIERDASGKGTLGPLREHTTPGNGSGTRFGDLLDRTRFA